MAHTSWADCQRDKLQRNSQAPHQQQQHHQQQHQQQQQQQQGHAPVNVLQLCRQFLEQLEEWAAMLGFGTGPPGAAQPAGLGLGQQHEACASGGLARPAAGNGAGQPAGGGGMLRDGAPHHQRLEEGEVPQLAPLAGGGGAPALGKRACPEGEGCTSAQQQPQQQQQQQGTRAAPAQPQAQGSSDQGQAGQGVCKDGRTAAAAGLVHCALAPVLPACLEPAPAAHPKLWALLQYLLDFQDREAFHGIVFSRECTAVAGKAARQEVNETGWHTMRV